MPDIGADIQRGSSWYGKYADVELAPGVTLWIPPGFTHGFQALEETLFIYLVTKGVLPPKGEVHKVGRPRLRGEVASPDEAILSEKDAKCLPLKKAENNFEYPI